MRCSGTAASKRSGKRERRTPARHSRPLFPAPRWMHAGAVQGHHHSAESEASQRAPHAVASKPPAFPIDVHESSGQPAAKRARGIENH